MKVDTHKSVGVYFFRGKMKKRSIPVTRKERQLKKEEPHDKIERHLADVTTQSNRRFTMNYTQNHKIAQVTENTLVVGVDIGSEQHYARAFDWRGLELTRKVFPFRNSLFHICFKPARVK